MGHARVERLLTRLMEKRSSQVHRDDSMATLREGDGHPAGSGSDIEYACPGRQTARPAADGERIERLIERRIHDVPLVTLCLV